MAPEQALGEAVDERSDIFSLGATFFHLFTGQLPFNRDTATAVLVQIAHEDAPRLTAAAPEAPAALAVVIGRMMARRREERYQEVGVILEDLASYERRGLLSGAGLAPALATPATHAGAQTKVHSRSSLAAQYADS
jgi:serine/threonine protein kinase